MRTPAQIIVTKVALARELGVSKSTVSTWIRRRQLTSPALRRDGKVNLDTARKQLAERVGVGRVMDSGSAAGARTPDDLAASREILRARALTATIEAERARRLDAERGRYCLTADVEKEWAATLTEIVNGIEERLPALDRDLALDRAGMKAVRNWWNETRRRLSMAFGDKSAGKPEFIEDDGTLPP
jgi:transcriptional regulator with XRE-family HTH domain